jgi:hypothetical protein
MPLPASSRHRAVAERPNGLASLADARQRARRTMPPPRHPATRAEQLSSPSDAGTALEGDQRLTLTSVNAAEPRQPPAHVPARDLAAQPTTAQTSEPKGSTATVQPPVKLTLYLDQDIDQYLEDVRILGLTAQPRVDVSRSAVVRLALRRLRSEMTPQQVETLLAGQPVDSSRTGRKRR